MRCEAAPRRPPRRKYSSVFRRKGDVHEVCDVLNMIHDAINFYVLSHC